MSKIDLVITLHKSELIYDVRNKTYLIGRNRYNGKNDEQVANMQVNEEGEHMEQILRSIGDAYNGLKLKLAKYYKNVGNLSDKVSNVWMNGEGNLEFILEVPGNFDRNVVDTIASGCHKFIVNTAIGEWFAITKPDEAEMYLAKAGNGLAEIHAAINKRVRPIREVEDDKTAENY